MDCTITELIINSAPLMRNSREIRVEDIYVTILSLFLPECVEPEQSLLT